MQLEEAIVLEEMSRRQNKKYKAEQIDFQARVNPERLPDQVRNDPLSAAVNVVYEIFRSLIRRASEGLSPSDLIRFVIRANRIDKPISTRIMPLREMTVEKAVSPIMKVLQSKEEIHLDEGFIVDIVTIRKDMGAGRIRRVINVEVDRLRKQSILSIPTDDEGLCAAKAIIYALAHLEGDRNTIKTLGDRRRPTLLNRAREIHVAAGVPIGPCTYTEISQLENHLNVQVVVISAENLNQVSDFFLIFMIKKSDKNFLTLYLLLLFNIYNGEYLFTFQVSYKGAAKTKRVNLWLHNNHYDVIKSLKGFYASNFYCEACEKPFQKIEDHKCENSCHICRRFNCMPGQSHRCSDCDRLCKSEDCFAAHKQRTGEQQLSLCDRVSYVI